MNISVNNTKLQAIAYRAGMTDSVLTSCVYTLQCAAPTFTPVAWGYASAQNVTISTTTSGATIRYTTNGTIPNETVGTVYSNPVNISANCTLQAIAYTAGMTDSAVASGVYVISPQPPSTGLAAWYTGQSIPTGTTGMTSWNDSSGNNFTATGAASYASSVSALNNQPAVYFNGAQTMLTANMSSAFSSSTGGMLFVLYAPNTSGGYTYITQNNAGPAGQNWDNYQGAAYLETFINATGGRTNGYPGIPAGAQLLEVESSPTNGYEAWVSDTAGGGTPPSAQNWQAPTTFTLGGGGAGPDFTGWVAEVLVYNSANDTVRQGVEAYMQYEYGIGHICNAPTFTPTAGSYGSAQNVTISTNTGGATINYTTDGTTPSSTVGTVYSSAVAISANTTLQAIAYETGYTNSSVASAVYTLQCITPAFTPVAGTYGAVQTVTINTTTTGASIRYTTNGTTPSSTLGTVYSSPVSITATSTLEAIAYASGIANSPIAIGRYAIQCGTPSFTPAAGSYGLAQTVTISSTSSGATIRYTTDGSTPTETAGTVYSSPVTISVTATLNAIAYQTGIADSPVTSGVYTINGPCATPTFSVAAGTYMSSLVVFISTTTGGAAIRYTTDGSTPTETSGTLYGSAVSINANTTLKAIAYANEYADSAVASTGYYIQCTAPAFTPAAGSYASAPSVTITSTTGGATIRYTTDGSMPTETAGTVYSSAVNISANMTLQAIAYRTGMVDSPVASGYYSLLPANTIPPLTGLVAWYSGRNFPANTTTITSWNDFTTNQFTATGAASYASSVSALNNQPAVYFNGAQTMLTANMSSAFSSSSGGMLFVLYAPNTSGGYTYITQNNAGPAGQNWDNYQGAAYLETFINATGGRTNGYPGIPAGAQLLEVESSPANGYEAWVSDTAGGGTPPSAQNWQAPTTFTLGGGGAGPDFTGWVAEVLVYNSANDTVRQGVEGYVKDLYGIGSISLCASPTFSPAAGTYGPAQSVTISTSTGGASIRYTTNGTTPSSTVGTIYSSPVAISATSTLQAIAYETGLANSTVTTGIYTINGACATPTFSPAAGTYTSATVTISTTTSGASIRYTTNGTTPSSTVGTVYSSPVAIGQSGTLQAIAYKTNYSNSAVASAAYTIYIGYTTAGSTNTAITANEMHGTRFQAGSAMTINHIDLDLDTSVAGNIQCAIYSDSSSVPGTFLIGTNALNNPGTGWQTFTLTSSQALTSGTYYWLMFWSAGNYKVKNITSSGSSWYRSLTYGTWPSSAGSGTAETRTWSIYGF